MKPKLPVIIFAGVIALGGTAYLTVGMPSHDKPSGTSTGMGTTHTGTTPAMDITCKPHSHAHGDGRTATEEGFSLKVLSMPAANTAGQIKLTITDDQGAKITSFTEAHGKQMHLIVVREDLGGYLHLHPVVGTDGVWSVDATIPSGGKWRVIADVVSVDDEDVILGELVDVKGAVTPFTLPSPSEGIVLDGYEFSVTGGISVDDHNSLMINATKDGKPVKLETYLGANAHLVAIKTDGTYAHFHPHSMNSMNACPDGQMPSNDPYAADDASVGMMHFMTEVPTEGTYRMFLQFQVDGVVHTATFTANVA